MPKGTGAALRGAGRLAGAAGRGVGAVAGRLGGGAVPYALLGSQAIEAVQQARTPDEEVDLPFWLRPFVAAGNLAGLGPSGELSPDAEAQIRQANQQAALRARLEEQTGRKVPPAAMGPGAVQPAPIPEELPERVQGEVTARPARDPQRNEPMEDVYARLGVEPWKVEEWRKQALADPAGQAGPFAVRGEAGRSPGGFIFGAQVPEVAGMDPEQFAEARKQHSPAVQRLMDEELARAQQQRAEAAAIEQTQAQTGALGAEADLRRAQAKDVEQGAMSLEEQLREQDRAYNFIMQLVEVNPRAQREFEVLFKSWLEENEGAPQEQIDAMEKFLKEQIAEKYYPGLLQRRQMTDPKWSIGAMRATGMMPGGGEL
jgi:hypothetical protein